MKIIIKEAWVVVDEKEDLIKENYAPYRVIYDTREDAINAIEEDAYSLIEEEGQMLDVIKVKVEVSLNNIKK